MTKLLSVDAFRAERRREGAGPSASGVLRVSLGEPVAFDDGSRRIRFCFSDGSIDRMGDTIDPNGWTLENFLGNPVALWAHDSSAPPIGRASNVGVDGARLMGDIEFAKPEVYDFADLIYRLTKEKFLNAVSVGFIPLEYKFSDDKAREWGIDFLSQDLLEISVCPVPANPNALGDARAKGIDTRPLVEWAEKALDGGGKVIIPRAELELLRKKAAEPKTIKPPKTKDDGASEADPASGGALVATCARDADEECGLINPQECAVHRSADDEKRLAALIAKAVTAGVSAALKVAPNRRRRKDNDGPDGTDDEPVSHEECVRAARVHMKAAEDFYEQGDEHHDKAMDLLDDAIKALDEEGEPEEDPGERSESNDDDDGEGGEGGDGDKARAAARLRRRAARIRARIS